MRKIKRLHHLRKEQQRLHHRQAELKDAIRSDWKDIRQTLEPATLAWHTLSSCTAWLGQRLFRKRTAK